MIKILAQIKLFLEDTTVQSDAELMQKLEMFIINTWYATTCASHVCRTQTVITASGNVMKQTSLQYVSAI